MHHAAIRGLFVLAVAVLPLQLVARELYSEPYPGLYQPSFGGDVPAGKTYTTLEPQVTVTDAAEGVNLGGSVCVVVR